MKKLTALLICIAFLLVGCTAQAYSNPDSAPSPTAAQPTPTFTQPKAPAFAVCMDNMDHPVHRMVQLGFIDRLNELAYKDISIIGTVTGDNEEQFASARSWAEKITEENKKGCLLLWTGDDACKPLLRALDKLGVYVGIPHFIIADENGNMPEGLTFSLPINLRYHGNDAASYIVPYLEGRRGKVIVAVKEGSNSAEPSSFKAALGRHGENFNLSKVDIEVINLESSSNDKNKLNKCRQSLEEGDVLAVYSVYSAYNDAWIQAISESATDIPLMLTAESADLSYKPLLEQGVIDMMIVYPLYNEGRGIAGNFHNLLLSGSVTNEVGWCSSDIVTRKNADEFFAEYEKVAYRVNNDIFFNEYK